MSDRDGESCLLEYPQRPHPLIWPGLLLGIAGLYRATYIARARGINLKIGFGFALALTVTAAFAWIALRNTNATGVASFRTPAADGTVSELRVWTRSGLFGRPGEGSLSLRDIRVVQATISARESAFFIYDCNPLAIRGLADAFDTVPNLRTLELESGALPAVERLRLADVLATVLAW